MMDQREKRIFLIRYLMDTGGYKDDIPDTEKEQKDLLRTLMNIRMPGALSEEYERVEDEYLRADNESKGITKIRDLVPVRDDIFLWQGDITTLECDAVVNAANSQMLGCFRPLHNCEDNCIHSAAGLRLRNYCYGIMRKQGHEEVPGQAKITPAFSLPSRYVIHTVGPVVNGELTSEHCRTLASCYESCLDCALEAGCGSIALCCISTGVFGFPRREAAEIAVRAVTEWKERHKTSMKIIFNVFLDEDMQIYSGILKK